MPMVLFYRIEIRMAGRKDARVSDVCSNVLALSSGPAQLADDSKC
jgi:hypothetical protein